MTTFAQQWGRYAGTLFLIPKLPYHVASTTFEPPGEIRDPDDWMTFSETDPPLPGFLNNRFQVKVPVGTDRLTVVLAGTMPNMSGFGVKRQTARTWVTRKARVPRYPKP